MQRIVNPRQTCLFDPFDAVLTETTRHRLLDGWPGVFRHVILELMPVDVLRGHFSPRMGRPTQELYSMAGLVLLMEFLDWTKSQAVDAYSFRLDVQYALNLAPVAHDLSRRTLERYLQLFERDELAQRVLHEVTTCLVEQLGLKIDQQRLDSTHVLSDMACLGRTRLLGVAIKRFLTQVKRHDPTAYAALEAPLRERYAPSDPRLFSETGQDHESRRQLRQQVAEDLYQLLRVFQAISLKIAGWNILRASVCATMRELVHAKAQTAVFRLWAWVWTASHACRNAIQGLTTVIPAFHRPFPYCLGLPCAA